MHSIIGYQRASCCGCTWLLEIYIVSHEASNYCDRLFRGHELPEPYGIQLQCTMTDITIGGKDDKSVLEVQLSKRNVGLSCHLPARQSTPSRAQKLRL